MSIIREILIWKIKCSSPAVFEARIDYNRPCLRKKINRWHEPSKGMKLKNIISSVEIQNIETIKYERDLIDL